jgi:catechol 2,3-dioxygenase-like lactoylglutathione lyase family enzyme
VLTDRLTFPGPPTVPAALRSLSAPESADTIRGVQTSSAAIDHIGIGVPDLDAAKRYYDDFVAIVGFTEWFPADEHQFNYGPDGASGTQLFFYRADESSAYSRRGTGLQHLAFTVPERAVVRRAHQWATERGSEVIHPPRVFPEYGEHAYATYLLDPHGIMLEVVCHAADVDDGAV